MNVSLYSKHSKGPYFATQKRKRVQSTMGIHMHQYYVYTRVMQQSHGMLATSKVSK